jgi:monofunctional biosynthetic peptidoglycan transglycosylase
VLLRWINPPTTAVQFERHMHALIHGKPYEKRYDFVPLSRISLKLQHAVISAEDARFYMHHGFDWQAIQLAAQQDLEGGRIRGGSTLTQQLVKNLFFGTSRSILRKGAESTLVPVAELVLGKRRILELYLNVVEWEPGVYGADAACRYHDDISARSIDREEAARLAAVLPSPLKRKPARMNGCARWGGKRLYLPRRVTPSFSAAVRSASSKVASGSPSRRASSRYTAS